MIYFTIKETKFNIELLRMRIMPANCTRTRPTPQTYFWRDFGGKNHKGAKLLRSVCATNLVAKMSKTYKLRSGRSYTPASLDENSSSPGLKQSTIQFRKRRHLPSTETDSKLNKSTTENIADLLSPPKRSKQASRSLVLLR